ncbi:hypothetical protein CGLAU_09990 [Corynebacterium glaucum]|uniref:Uncharacterized protein n=1 Tax=Corynebacterium glaucum TaxID=187491 RepID=A0A1Q2HYK7_9CORY|nr:hypothetical protein CGLAU_09990 [Corynebacterium glaucum]WJZ08429.1 hypothetical protein CGLAUT_09785 [Corynebacterium glaucum]
MRPFLVHLIDENATTIRVGPMTLCPIHVRVTSGYRQRAKILACFYQGLNRVEDDRQWIPQKPLVLAL